MPVGHVENIALSLNDGSQKRGAEVIGVQKLGVVTSPIRKVFGDILSLLCSSAEGYRLD